MSWSTATLGELADRDGGLIQTGPFGSQLHQTEYQAEGIPVIMPKDIADGRVSIASVARVSDETASRLGRHQIKHKGIVLPRRGEISKRAFIRKEQEGWLCGTGCLKIEFNGEQLVPEFLFYYMDQPQVVRWLEQHAVGTTMLNLSTEIVSKLPIRYPKLAVQVAIAEILCSYDDLIENNRRRMALLEEAARQLYREWFVRLRFPGHEHTRIIDGVPEGWRLRPISELVDGIYDGPHATPPSADDGPVFLGIKNISECGRLDLTDVRHIAENDFPRWTKRVQPREGDVVFSYEATLHRYAVIPPGFRGCLGRRLALIRPKPGKKNGLFLFQSLLGDRWRGTVEANVISGATVERIPIGKLPGFPLLIPPDRLVHGFEEVASDLYRQIQTLTKQNQRVRGARDLLLPRLMSGEIAV